MATVVRLPAPKSPVAAVAVQACESRTVGTESGGDDRRVGQVAGERHDRLVDVHAISRQRVVDGG